MLNNKWLIPYETRKNLEDASFSGTFQENYYPRFKKAGIYFARVFNVSLFVAVNT